MHRPGGEAVAATGAPAGGEAVVANHLGVYIEADPMAHHCPD